MTALGDRVDHDHDRRLEQRGDHAREARTHRPVGVEVGAGEQEQRDEDRQRGDVLGLVVGEDEVRLVPDGGLRLERRPDGEENADRVERAQHGHARDRAEGVEPDQRAQQERPAGPDVTARKRDAGCRLHLL